MCLGKEYVFSMWEFLGLIFDILKMKGERMKRVE